MVRVRFTRNLERHVRCPPEVVDARTVGDALERVFERHPQARGYVLDDQGALRRHVAVFVDGEAVRDREGLSDPVSDAAEVCVLQALSGG